MRYFAPALKPLTDFPLGDLTNELHELMSDLKIRGELEIHVPTKEGDQLLEYAEKDARELRIQYFSRFLHLDPSYFRYAIQHHRLLDIQESRRRDLSARIFAVCKDKFPQFVNDDANRIIGWATYFGIFRPRMSDDLTVFSFSPQTVAQFAIETLVRFINSSCENRRNFIWKQLRQEILDEIVFEECSFLSAEGLLSVIVEQNRGQCKWTFVERGLGRYPGFKGDAAKQMLQILTYPLSYQFTPRDATMVMQYDTRPNRA